MRTTIPATSLRLFVGEAETVEGRTLLAASEQDQRIVTAGARLGETDLHGA